MGCNLNAFESLAARTFFYFFIFYSTGSF